MSKELTDEEKLIAGIIGFIFGMPIRIAIVTACLYYSFAFWTVYLDRPNNWLWWYGSLLSLPFAYGWFGKLVARGSMLAALATFLASFFV